MNYGLARKVEIYNFMTDEQETVIARPSAWHEASLWEANHKNEVKKEIEGVHSTYAWAYFALKQNGLLEKHGLPDNLTRDTISDMMDAMSVSLVDLKDDDLPLVK